MGLRHADGQAHIGNVVPVTCQDIWNVKPDPNSFRIDTYFPFGFHSCASFCASAIWAGVI